MATGTCRGCGRRKPLYDGTCTSCLGRRPRFGNAPAHRWDGKIAGKDFRLQWSRNTWLLEELPQKGKKKLRVATFNNPGGQYGGRYRGMDAFIAENVLRHARVSPSDSYSEVKTKIGDAMAAASKEVVAKAQAEGDRTWDFLLRSYDWSENSHYFTEVMPEGMEPFNADGKDFVVATSWTKFSAYDPASDFQQSDPHYSVYESSAPASGRKLYQILHKDPQALQDVSWSGFGTWLKDHKIPYEIRHSVWH
jgi:hypothetical protein